jgi:hypothetical protein
MTDEQLACEIAKGIGSTGVEGGYNSVSCSTAGDYPSMGISQWEGLGGRGDTLLGYIDGGNKFAGRSYSDIRDNGGLSDLQGLLDSTQGQAAQNDILTNDCLEMYLPALKRIPGFDDSRCMIYAGIWCPTSQDVVQRFLTNRYGQYDLTNLEAVRDIFCDQYYIAASVGPKYAEGYANRANNTFDYVSNLDLSAYGVPQYGV